MEIKGVSGANYGSILFLRYLSFYSLDSGRIWYSRKALHEENPTPYFTRRTEQNSSRTSDITGVAPPGLIDGYWQFPYWGCPILPLPLERRQSFLGANAILEVFGMDFG